MCIRDSSDTFEFSPNFTAPAIMLFDGNVSLVSGHSMSTILASGNITSSGQFKITAPNGAGFERVCEGNADHAPGSVRTRYQEVFSTHYAENLCDISSRSLTPLPVANVALGAGGFHPDNPSVYEGGDITLGASSDIIGSVLAGNVLTTQGDVYINGSLAAGGANESPLAGQENSFGGSTEIDLTSHTVDFDPVIIPNTTPLPPNFLSELLWVRNL